MQSNNYVMVYTLHINDYGVETTRYSTVYMYIPDEANPCV